MSKQNAPRHEAQRRLLARLRQLQADGALELPAPGAGSSSARHRALYAVARQDLSLARLAEAHTDALAILAEAGHAPRPDALYGVWASEGRGHQLILEGTGPAMTLCGSKRFCSGASLVDAALVTASRGDELLLVDVALSEDRFTTDDSGWATPAFAATATADARFDGIPVTSSAVVGGPRWYLDRPGFWHGALGPAACWAGGAAGLVDAAWRMGRDDAHSRAQLGGLAAAAWGLRALLDQAGDEVDADPRDEAGVALQRALAVRHLVEQLCTDVLVRFGRATGPALLAFDPAVAQRHAELTLYLRQCHAERDLEALAADRMRRQRTHEATLRLGEEA